MKKGFTLIEVMATIVILAVILLIAVPIYNGVRENINESIYNSKIEEVLSKAETFASENNAFVFDVKTLIENGEISADNETGIYMDPRTNRDMRCDILNAVYKENHYEVSITESDVCYDLEELENLYGMVELKLYDEAGSEIEKLENTDWLRNQEIHVRYEFKEEYQEYANSIESLLWTGEQVVSCSKEDLSTCQEYIVNTEEIKNVVVGLEVRVNMNGASMVNTVRKNILVDLQRPSVIDGSIVINNEISTNNERRVEFEISDGSGSGVRYTSIVKEKTCNGQEYEENKQSASDGIQSIYLGNGDYYICVEDQVGNRTRDEDLENPNNQIHVEGVDQSIPVISKFEVKSTTSSYNALTTNLSIEASDDSGSNGLQMCISNTGYLQGCSWEKYSSSKSWKVSGSLDGGVRTVYLSIQDSAGNIVNREAKYTVYKDCSNQTKIYTESNYGTCSKKCGGGLQYRAYQMKDIKTGTICTTGKDSKTCNTHGCILYRYRNIQNPTTTYSITRPSSKSYRYCEVGSLASEGNKCCVPGFASEDHYVIIAGKEYNFPQLVYNSCASQKSMKTIKGPDCNSGRSLVGPEFDSSDFTAWGMTFEEFEDIAEFYFDESGFGLFSSGYYVCERSTSTCPSGYTLSGNKCYGPWSSWSYTEVTANANREVQTKKEE